MLQRLGDALDAMQPGIPCRADGFELRSSLRELSPVDVVTSLASRRRRVHESCSVEYAEMLRHSLPADRKLFAQRRRCPTVACEKKVDDAAPRRISDGRPQRVVDVARRRLAMRHDAASIPAT